MLCGHCGDEHETLDAFWDRVSMGNSEYLERLIKPLVFLPNSPTLMNIGTNSGGTFSACFKFDVEDTMFDSPSGIMPTMMKAAKVLKAGGGVGYTFSKVRPRGAPVHSTHGQALGFQGVMRMYHQMAKEITQGGKRDAAQMGIIHCEHPSVRDFIHFKDDDPDAMSTFNISVALTDEFMRRATTDADSDEHAILVEMSESAWKTGDPGVYFIDEAERYNPTPWAGELTGTNPCGEVPLLDNEPCNLGSINLGKLYAPTSLRWDGIDYAELADVVALATRYLDDVLDRNVFPDPEIDAAARYTRKLGLGVCGFADLLAYLEVDYDSDGARGLADRLMKTINEVAVEESYRLAIEKGAAPCFMDDPDQTRAHPRNATRTCIAPTGTIAILMDASSGIEPYFALEWNREMGDGTMLQERPIALRDRNPAVAYNHWPKIANEIEYVAHCQMQAVFQKHTNLAVSKTINMAHDVTWHDIYSAYVMMWELKCKGGTIYRDASRTKQVLTAGQARLAAVGMQDEWRDALPSTRPGLIHKFEVGGVEGYLHTGEYENGDLAEIFLDVSRQGSAIAGMMDWVGQVFSVGTQIAHRHGTPFTVFSDKWIGRKFEPAGFTTNPDIPKVESIADYLGQFLRRQYGYPGYTNNNGTHTGGACPDCGTMLVQAEACSHCPACGYENC